MDKEIPNYIEGEKAILAGIILDNNTLPVVCDFLGVDDFYREAHRLVFSAMTKLMDTGTPIDYATLPAELIKSGRLEQAGGLPYILDLSTPSVANITHYAKIVKEKSILRHIINSANEVVQRAYGQCDLEELQDAMQNLALTPMLGQRRASLEPVRNYIGRVLDLFDQCGANVQGLPTGLKELDSIIVSGLQPHELVIVAARPEVGKSAFALNNLAATAQKGSAIAFFSLEMSNMKLTTRLLASKAKVPLRSLLAGQSTKDSCMSRLVEASGEIADMGIYLHDGPNMTVNQIRMKAKELAIRIKRHVGMIIVDYLQLISPTNPKASLNQQVAEMSRGLKLMAKELDCVVVALSQLNRGLEARPFLDKNGRHCRRPTLYDLRDSGAIEQDADIVLGFYRPEIYPEAHTEEGYMDDKYRGWADITVLKNREGQKGRARVVWNPEITTFSDTWTETERL